MSGPPPPAQTLSPDGLYVWDGSSWQARAVEAPRVLVTIGDIACTQATVITPAGSYPLNGTVWLVSNNTVTTQGIPAVAIVLCILFFLLCFLGLLFLLMKEERTSGFVQVSVQGPGLYHAVQIPASSPRTAIDLEQRVNYVRALVAALPGAARGLT
jgi:hypothetical protein